MKNRTTIKECRNLYNCYAVGYCAMQNLLHYETPTAYTAGVYGWNFDIYEFDNFAITTGYRGMIGKRIDYTLLRKYEKKAEAIIYDYTSGLTYNQKRARVRRLLKNLMERA